MVMATLRSTSGGRLAALRAPCCALVVLANAGLATVANAHPLGQYIYRDGDDKLVMTFPFQNYWPLRYRIPPYPGFLDHDYPFEEALGDRPTQNLFRTHLDAKIEVVLVDFSPGFYVRDPADIGIAYHNPGDRMQIGLTGTGFITFPWWHLDESDPEYLPGQEVYHGSYYLHDINGLHFDSDVYTFYVYPNVGFCPADLTTTAVVGAPGYGQPNQLLTSDDFFYYISAFAAGNMVIADITTTAVPGGFGYGLPDGIINSDDFFYYLALYSLGC